MARFDTSGIDDLIQEMTRMGQQVGPVAEQMVDAAADAIRDSWQEVAGQRFGKDPRATGQMAASVGFDGGPKRAGQILYKDVYPQGSDSKGVRNAEKAFILHYGRSNYPATYWVDEADDKSAEPVQTALETIWDRFLETGGG